MRVRSIHVQHFKRFADLTIRDLPSTARLVVLAGPNGSGKSSLFDALNSYARHRSHFGGWDATYHQRSTDVLLGWSQCVQIETDHTPRHDDLDAWRKMFYLRSAYRNDADFTLQSLTRVGSPASENRLVRMIDTDVAVTANYQRLASQALEDVFARVDGATTIETFREQVISDLRDATARLFPGLIMNSLGSPLEDGTFRFDKGESKRFSYKNLSGGEKAAFDLLLDLVVKRRTYDDTIFCIDEPEAHASTRVQGPLLEELVRLLPEKCQLWVATHSIGMLRVAREMHSSQPGSVVFLDFGGHDFDKPVVIAPALPTRTFWEKYLAVALDDLACLVAPRTVVVCEGTNGASAPGKNSDHDATCYNAIFAEEFPEVRFVSGGSSNEVRAGRSDPAAMLKAILGGVEVVRLIDRDDHSESDVAAFEVSGVRVLSRRHLECFLFDDEVLAALCRKGSASGRLAEVIADKNAALSDSIQRGNPVDDIKSAAGSIYTSVKRRLGLRGVGNDARAFQRETLAPLVRPGMAVYDELRRSVFGP